MAGPLGEEPGLYSECNGRPWKSFKPGSYYAMSGLDGDQTGKRKKAIAVIQAKR